MDITVIIQVAIGIIFVWIILAVITSQIQEWIASILAWRADMLESAIEQMLGNPAIKNKVYNHPVIQGLFTNHGKRKPGGIPQDKFALILFEEVINSGITVADAKNTFDNLKKSISAIKAAEGNSELKNFAVSLDTLLIGIEEKAGDATHAITEARIRVESWFNNSMERLTGAYRRRVQIVAIIVGISIAAVLNVDTGAITTTLWRDPMIRQAVVTEANQLPPPNTTEPGTTGEQTTQPPSAEVIVQSMNDLNALSLPVGWSFKTADTDPNTLDDPRDFPSSGGGWVAKILGILLSGMAAAQGAPYWFDLMRKLVTRNPPVAPQPA
jgi:hypothetical protein